MGAQQRAMVVEGAQRKIVMVDFRGGSLLLPINASCAKDGNPQRPNYVSAAITQAHRKLNASAALQIASS